VAKKERRHDIVGPLLNRSRGERVFEKREAHLDRVAKSKSSHSKNSYGEKRAMEEDHRRVEQS